MKKIKDIQTGDIIWAAFQTPGTETWNLKPVEIFEGIDFKWLFIRQKMETSPVGFVGEEIYFNPSQMEDDYLKQNGIYFFADKTVANKFIKEQIINRSIELRREINKLNDKLGELACTENLTLTVVPWNINSLIFIDKI